jgi:hypothetical protein
MLWTRVRTGTMEEALEWAAKAHENAAAPIGRYLIAPVDWGDKTRALFLGDIDHTSEEGHLTLVWCHYIHEDVFKQHVPPSELVGFPSDVASLFGPWNMFLSLKDWVMVPEKRRPDPELEWELGSSERVHNARFDAPWVSLDIESTGPDTVIMAYLAEKDMEVK